MCVWERERERERERGKIIRMQPLDSLYIHPHNAGHGAAFCIGQESATTHWPRACHALEPCGRSTLHRDSRARWSGAIGTGTLHCITEPIFSNSFRWLKAGQIASDVFALSYSVLHCSKSTTLESFSDGILVESRSSDRLNNEEIVTSVDSRLVSSERPSPASFPVLCFCFLLQSRA